MHADRRTDSFQTSIDQAITSLYFLRISNSFSSSSSVNAAKITTSFSFSSSKKAYFKCLGNSFNANPFELVSVSLAFSSLLLDFSVNQDTGNSSHFHSLNFESYNHLSVQN